MSAKFGFRLWAGLGCISLTLWVLSPLAGAAQGLQLTTPYPAVVVEAGKTATFNVSVKTPSQQRVALDVIEAPPGWQATLNGGGFNINGVFGAPDNPPAVQVNVKVPAGAAKADYKVLVRGNASGAIDILELDLKVAEVAQGAVTLATDFPELRSATSKTFTYNLTLANNTPESTSFNLSADGPPGWQITARPAAEQNASTVKVEGGGTGSVTVEATAPEGAVAGKNQIKVSAEGGTKRAEITVTAEITGNAKVTLSTDTKRLNAQAVAGKVSKVMLEVKNEGTTTVSGLKLSSSPPAGWKVTFKPENLPPIRARSLAKAVAMVTPSGDAVAGDYNITMTAGGQGSTSNADIRVSVKTSGLFGLVGIVVIGAAIYFLLRVFNQYGRR